MVARDEKMIDRVVSSLSTILYGGDYNPEQWPEEVWQEDMKLMKEAHINEVTLNVFSWSLLQPSESEYDFHLLDRIVDICKANGLRIVMATGTGALPAWMCLRHPDVNRIGYNGEIYRHNGRENFCASSPTFRKYAGLLAAKMAQHYVERGDAGASDSPIVAWHLSNEYSGFCWCDRCAQAFREWLKAKYHNNIDEVNDAWNAHMWSHTYHSFDEIFPPNTRGDGMEGSAYWAGHAVLGGYSLDYRHFYNDQVRACIKLERDAVRTYDTYAPITTNMMGTFNDYDYYKQGELLDVISWDSYPGLGEDAAAIDMRHDLMRGVAHGEPWMLMEQAPSNQNWMPYCYVKRPGQLAELSWQAVAHGANTVQYFQIRQARSGCEKFHSGIISADGTNKTRRFREAAQLGKQLEQLSAQILATKPRHGQVALIFDWNAWWDIQFSVGPTQALDYVAECQRWYRELHRRNIAVDVVSPLENLQDYQAVLTPCLQSVDKAVVENLRNYVSHGGRLLMTTMTAVADEHDSLYQGEQPVPLRDLAGIWVEETDSLAPSTPVGLAFTGEEAQAPQASPSTSKESAPAAAKATYGKATYGEVAGDKATGNKVAGGEQPYGTTLFDVLHADSDTEVLATYTDQFYAGTPALTFHALKQGGKLENGAAGVIYCATMPNEPAIARIVDRLLAGLAVEQMVTLPMCEKCQSCGTPCSPDCQKATSAIEITRRVARADKPGARDLVFVMNTAEPPVSFTAPVSGKDLLTGKLVKQGDTLTMAGFETLILQQ